MNHNLQDIMTPVKADVLERLLNETGYNLEKTKYLIQGFKQGFSLMYSGPENRQDTSKNIPLRVGNKFELW